MEKLEMQNHVSEALTKSIEGSYHFQGVPRIAYTSDGGAALDLVFQAAEAVRDIEDRAYETEQHARTIAERAVEKLRIAEECIRYLEAQQQAAQARISETNIEIQIVREALKHERFRVAAAENQLRELKVRATTNKLHASAVAMIFAKRVRRKIADMITYVKSNVICVKSNTGKSDYSRCKLGWTEILARADAALNEGGRRKVYHRLDRVLQRTN